jgi:aspartokinase/homoserine dehydrogenase 1
MNVRHSRERAWSLLLFGKGTVGGHVLSLLASESERLRAEGVDLRLVGLVDRRGAVVAASLDPRTAREAVRIRGEKLEVAPLLDRVRAVAGPDGVIAIDCTASREMTPIYREAFDRGLHVVTANKHPLVHPFAEYAALIAGARSSGTSLRYETTVGAALPVIGTLRDLVRTGDVILQIEGSLSGTLGFLADEVSRGVPLSIAVRDAHQRGYSEPHPRDDLSGHDVGRKALILAREIGMMIEPGDVTIEPFVPTELLAEHDARRFLEKLAQHDGSFEARIARLRSRGRALRYLATIAPTAVRAGPVEVPVDHPAARLHGTTAMIAIYSRRYADTPLIVQGPGAGGAVTAAGVLADVLAIARESSPARFCTN